MVSSPVGPVRPDSIRRHNLSLLLEHVHLDGAMSRAELTQRLQVSRSTVGALVADLIELGLIDETVPSGGSGVGRPSHVIGPRRDGPYVAAVDVDVTQVVTAAVGIGGSILGRIVVDLDERLTGPNQVAAVIADSIADLPRVACRRVAPIAVGVGIPGTVDRSSGRIGVAPNLGWLDVPFGQRLAALLAGPALAGPELHIRNDADLAVLAEHRRGAARHCSDVVFLMGRIGVGAGMIVNGLPAGGRDGHAGEIGHTMLDANGPQCHCGKRGCVETYVGELALLALAGRTGPAVPEAMAALFTDARNGDRAAMAALRAVAEPLGRTIALLVNMLNPQRVLLGGFLSNLFDVTGAEIEAALARHALETPRSSAQLAQPAFGTDATLVGAAEVAFASLLADPLLADPLRAG